MRHLCRTTAIAAALGVMAFGAQAQSSDQEQQTSSAPSYCDTQWTMVDDDSDGFVDRAEASGAVERQFKQIDADGNGEITKTEYVDCMTRTGEQVSAEVERDEESFRQADADKDSSVSREEFRDAARQAYDDGQSASADDEDAVLVLRRFVWLTPEDTDETLRDMSADEMAARSAKIFNALDGNDDDILDTEEWAARSPSSGVSEDWASAEFDKIDDDKTGSISQDEYVTARTDMLDEMNTASTQDSASSDGAEQSGQDVDLAIPVYVYRFWAM